MTAQEHVLDVSDLEAPEPMEQVLSFLENLKCGEYLRMLHRREPFPLYAILKERGFAFDIFFGKSTNFEILIWHCHDQLAERAVKFLKDK